MGVGKPKKKRVVVPGVRSRWIRKEPRPRYDPQQKPGWHRLRQLCQQHDPPPELRHAERDRAIRAALANRASVQDAEDFAQEEILRRLEAQQLEALTGAAPRTQLEPQTRRMFYRYADHLRRQIGDQRAKSQPDRYALRYPLALHAVEDLSLPQLTTNLDDSRLRLAGEERHHRARLRCLSRRQRLLARLITQEGLTLAQCGEQLGVSESRCSQMVNEIVAALEEYDRRFERDLPPPPEPVVTKALPWYVSQAQERAAQCREQRFQAQKEKKRRRKSYSELSNPGEDDVEF